MESVKEKGKARFYILLSCCAAALLSLGVLIGVLLSARGNAEAEDVRQIAAVPQQSAMPAEEKNKTAVYDAYFVRTAFINCAHTEERYVSGCAYTKEELEGLYADCILALHETGKPLLRREIAEYCPRHYVLQLRGLSLNVEQYDMETGTRRIVKTIEAEPQTMPDSIQKELEVGVPFESLAQIDEYIENAES